MKDELQVLWLRPLRKLSSLMLSENPCSEGNSVYRHTGCSYSLSADTQISKLLEGTLFCLELTIDLCTCSAPDTPAIEEVGQCGGDLENNQIICPKSLLVPFSVFHQYNIVVQLLKVTDPKVNWKELLVKQYL